jgi:hypothetical protein
MGPRYRMDSPSDMSRLQRQYDNETPDEDEDYVEDDDGGFLEDLDED